MGLRVPEQPTPAVGEGSARFPSPPPAPSPPTQPSHVPSTRAESTESAEPIEEAPWRATSRSEVAGVGSARLEVVEEQPMLTAPLPVLEKGTRVWYRDRRRHCGSSASSSILTLPAVREGLYSCRMHRRLRGGG